MNKFIGFAFLTLTLAGCGSIEPDTLRLEKATAIKLGLASTDELTISNIQKGTASMLGSTPVSYDVKTNKGRLYSCNYIAMPGLLPTEEAKYDQYECAPKSKTKK